MCRNYRNHHQLTIGSTRISAGNAATGYSSVNAATKCDVQTVANTYRLVNVTGKGGLDDRLLQRNRPVRGGVVKLARTELIGMKETA